MPVNLKFLHNAPFFQNGAKSGFEMCFGLSTLGAGAKTRLESRIKEFTPHCVCRPGAPSRFAHSRLVLWPVFIDNTLASVAIVAHGTAVNPAACVHMQLAKALPTLGLIRRNVMFRLYSTNTVPPGVMQVDASIQMLSPQGTIKLAFKASLSSSSFAASKSQMITSHPFIKMAPKIVF